MKDFFISYNKADRKWAEWIAWIVEDAGYSTIIQAWDFRSGGNFVLEMHKATVETSKTIAVLSEQYLSAEYTQPEWAAVLARDPKGNFNKLIPIRVSSCTPNGLLAQLIYTDLVDLNEIDAKQEIINSLQVRGKPVSAPPFPGASLNNGFQKPAQPTTTFQSRIDEPEQKKQEPVEEPTRSEVSTGDGVLTPNMKLSEFFKLWYLPVLLQGRTEEATIKLYDSAIHYWSELTNDPPLNKINEFMTSKFVDDLLKTTYRRGRFGKKLVLKPNTAKKHITAIRSILYRTGPSTDPGRPAMELIRRVPYIRMPKVRTKAKAPFPLSVARQIIAAAQRMKSPNKSATIPRLFWTAYCAGGFYLGVGATTVLRLTRKMVVRIHDEWWIDIPQEAFAKTGKPMKRRLHPKLIEIWSKLFTLGDTSDKLIIEWTHDYRHLTRQHKLLQKIAGVTNILSPETWRRTHLAQMAELGYGLTQDWSDRSSETTTEDPDADVKNKFVTRLPDLWDGPLEENQASPQVLF